ncbi:NADP-dependent malic enzyme [bacterium]|nr:NADP-dependent malic enzyme [bacterium]
MATDNEKTKQQRARAALEYHRGSSRPAGAGEKRFGKIEIIASKPLTTQQDLSYAYSPGVAQPCKEIAANPDEVYQYTAKGNLVGVVTNGTAVLGLGDIGPLAAKPVMEGKAVLFKKFADIDGMDIEVKATDSAHFISVVQALEPTFGGINLEDIKAPECFEIERILKETMNIPVFHDDQHGTAIISGAAVLNALEIGGKKIDEVKVVFCGGGAASISVARFWLTLGVKLENCVMTDRKGVISKDRTDEMNPYKMEFAIDKSWHKTMPKTVDDAVVDADIFVGCSVGGALSKEALKTMAPNPIVFALANPDPEITYEDAISVRDDLMFATGRSDYPNQVNNVLGFPFIFRGALDVRATNITEGMKIAAARALADLAKEPVPESVIQAYGGKPIKFGPEYIIPKPFDPRALLWVAPAVAEAAIKEKVARRELPGMSIEGYRARLEKLLNRTRSVMRDLKDRFSAENSTSEQVRLVLPEGTNDRILQAAALIKEERIAEPILIGDPDVIRPMIEDMNLYSLNDVEIIRPSQASDIDGFAVDLWELRKRKGMTPDLANQYMKDPMYYGAMLVKSGKADACLAGVTRSYPETIRPALQVIGTKDGHKVAGIYMLLHKEEVYFIADTTVNINPTAEELADIAIDASDVASKLGFEPRVAMLSFSNFGSNRHPEARKVAKAVEILKEKSPNLLVDGELHADIAISPEILQDRYPFSPLKDRGANILICPNLASANIAYKLLGSIGDVDLVGPILTGMAKPIHVLQLNADVNEIFNMALIAVMDKRLQTKQELARE